MESKKENMRITTIRDVNDILALYPEADEERLAKIRTDVEKDIMKAEKGDRIVYGIEKDGKVVGTVQLVFRDEKEFYADEKTKAHVHHARVSEELRGKGIGANLMEVAENEARKRGFKEMTLGVDEDNIRAIKLYERLGYKEFMREKGDQGEPIIGMKKDL
ncbi:MAG: GNAT family N-acetyltransferase [Candidatus Sungbacteria bacterium]|nr:GNAT family N-acetyltransferase [Candidatus Sungbacteria bacterium]